jgi:hypothetical protein
MGLLERIRSGTYLPDGGSPLVTPGHRLTARDAGAHVAAGDDPVIVARELLDHIGRAGANEIAEMIAERPEPTGDPRADALLGGVAEYASALHEAPCPSWTSEPDRFLDRFWFVSAEPGLRAIAIAQTPVALKRRGIFWPAHSLRRV